MTDVFAVKLKKRKTWGKKLFKLFLILLALKLLLPVLGVLLMRIPFLQTVVTAVGGTQEWKTFTSGVQNLALPVTELLPEKLGVLFSPVRAVFLQVFTWVKKPVVLLAVLGLVLHKPVFRLVRKTAGFLLPGLGTGTAVLNGIMVALTRFRWNFYVSGIHRIKTTGLVYLRCICDGREQLLNVKKGRVPISLNQSMEAVMNEDQSVSIFRRNHLLKTVREEDGWVTICEDETLKLKVIKGN